MSFEMIFVTHSLDYVIGDIPQYRAGSSNHVQAKPVI